MTRLLVLMALIVICGYFAAEQWSRLRAKIGKWPPSETLQPRERELVACSLCGVHVPRARAVGAPSAVEPPDSEAAWLYCSEICRRRAASTPDAMRSKSA